MKVAALLACACLFLLTAKRASCAAIKAPLDVISLDDLSESDRKTLEYLDAHYPRPKRSQHYDLLSTLKSAVGNGIKSKLGLIAKGSVSAVSHLSGGSSGGGHGYHHYDVPETYDHKSFDFWTLKKSILNTLLQAVKAIKGGVIAIKGQLIKGSGYLISAKGKLISSKGEAITSLGKNIASSAVLVPFPHHHSGSDAHVEYGEPHDHFHVSGPSEYGSPSAPGPEYELPDHHYHNYPSPHIPPHHDDKPDADHAGILILKKIPKHQHDHDDHHDHDTHHSDEHAHYLPDFKPLEPSGPSFGTIVGKFFSASTSLKPGEPAPFGDSAPGHDHHDHHEHEHHGHHEHDYDPSPLHHHAEAHHDHYHHANHAPSAPSHEYYPPSGPSKPPTGPFVPEFSISGPGPSPSGPSHTIKPPSTNYGVPFEEAPAYLNIPDYQSGSESKKIHQTAAKPTKNDDNRENKIKYDEIRPLNVAIGQNIVNSFDTTLNSPSKPNLFIGAQSEKGAEQFPPYQSQALSSAESIVSHNLENFAQFGGFPSNAGADKIKFLAQPPSSSSNFHNSFVQNSAGRAPVPPHLKLNVYKPNYGFKAPKRPTRSKTVHRPKKGPNFEFVRSIGYELGPNGPKRL